MEYLIIVMVVAMLYFIIGCFFKGGESWDGSDIDGGLYGKKMVMGKKAVKKRTRKSTSRAKALPKTVKKKTTKRKTKRKTKKK